MKLSKTLFMQEGGPMPAGDPAVEGGAPMGPESGAPAGPEAGGQEEMMAQIGQMALQIIQQLGPEAAAMLAQAITEMLQGGGEQLPPEEQQPVYQRFGGQIRRIR